MNSQVELSCPKEMAWKVNMHRGYLAICHPEEQQLNFIERLVEMASSLAIREWRRLPHIVSHVHTPLLQVGTQNASLHLERCDGQNTMKISEVKGSDFIVIVERCMSRDDQRHSYGCGVTPITASISPPLTPPL